MYCINCTDCTVSIVLIVLNQLYWLYFILFTLGERIRPQIDVSYEYVEEGDALDLRCNVRVSFYILSPDLFFTSYFINGVYKSNWEYRIKIKVCIWYTGKTKILKYFFLSVHQIICYLCKSLTWCTWDIFSKYILKPYICLPQLSPEPKVY